MSIINQIAKHPIYDMMGSYQEEVQIAKMDEDYIERVGQYGLESLERIYLVFKVLDNKLNSSDPYLLRKSTLDQLHSEVKSIINELKNYNQSLITKSQLNQVNNRIDNVVQYIGYLPTLVEEESFQHIRDSITSLRMSIGQQRSNLEREQERLQSESDNIDEKIIEKQKRLEELSGQIDHKIEELKKDYIELSQELINEQKDYISDRNEQQQIYDDMLNKHKKSVEELVGIISTNSISGHFKEVADRSEKSRRLWQFITVLAFLVTISSAVYFFIIYTESSLEWTNLVARIIVTSAVGSFTAYASNQASKNEREEKENRKMEVELKTLNPYLASFDPDKQEQLKEQLFPSIFRQDIYSTNERDKEGS